MGDATLGSNSTNDDYLPLSEEKYGEYFNQSWEFYRNGSGNMTDRQVVAIMLDNCKNQTAQVEFDTIQLIRVLITWTLFFVSAVGNSFVLFCVCRKARTSHVHMIMLHFAIADLTFTFMVLPKDAMWNTTMLWVGGDWLCRVCQMGTQIGMYISSFMVVVMALDRCCGILQPMAIASKQRRRTKCLVGGAWILSIISAIPPVILFGVVEMPFCPDRPPMRQCVDYYLVPQAQLKTYYFYTMAMSFLLPMMFSVIFYSLVVCEISNMMRRDRVMMGRRDSAVSITRARKKTLKMTAMVTLSFLLCWGPYYGYGVYFWFNPTYRAPKQVSTILFLVMYFHPALHPFLYGVLMKDVRDTFNTVMLHFEKILTCNASELSCGDGSFTCLSSPEKTHFSQSNGYVRAVDGGDKTSPQRTGNPVLPPIVHEPKTGERDRLISATSEQSRGAGDDVIPPPQQQTANGVATRTSTVSFRLPSSSSGGDAVTVLNNNNKELNHKEDVIFKSTDV